MTKRLQLLERFGRLRVLIPKGRVIKKDGTYKRDKLVLCICDCGALVAVRKHSLERGDTRSCGCFNQKVSRERLLRHGGRGTSEYASWREARKRCNNPNVSNYHNYGGRGITFHAAWDDFKQFLSDMGPKPSPKHTLERVDVNKNYCPENCIWATREEQNNNRRDNVYVLLEGQRMTLTQAAKKLDFKYNTASSRRHAGWPPARWFSPVAEVQLVS